MRIQIEDLSTETTTTESEGSQTPSGTSGSKALKGIRTGLRAGRTGGGRRADDSPTNGIFGGNP